jgi:hypothetical protein
LRGERRNTGCGEIAVRRREVEIEVYRCCHL